MNVLKGVTVKGVMVAGLVFLAVGLGGRPAVAGPPDWPKGPDLGRPATPGEIAGWDTTIGPDGSGLPPGGGTARQGAAVYEKKCLSCHGPGGQGRSAEELVGGVGELASEFPDKTVGSYWPYATTLYDYIFRAMPMDAPRSLTPHEVYALSAYLLALNGIIGPDDEMNLDTLPAIKMPNRDGFVHIYHEGAP